MQKIKLNAVALPKPQVITRTACVVLVVLVFLITGCSKGTYQADLFPEMHYQQSFKYQEPPRLAPNPAAVPITGKEVQFSGPKEASVAPNPLSPSKNTLQRGAEVYRINCSMCHGVRATGNGPVGAALVNNRYPRPPNLTLAATQDKTDGDIFWIITSGVVVMPSFKHLLSETDRWALVSYLRSLGQGAR